MTDISYQEGGLRGLGGVSFQSFKLAFWSNVARILLCSTSDSNHNLIPSICFRMHINLKEMLWDNKPICSLFKTKQWPNSFMSRTRSSQWIYKLEELCTHGILIIHPLPLPSAKQESPSIHQLTQPPIDLFIFSLPRLFLEVIWNG